MSYEELKIYADAQQIQNEQLTAKLAEVEAEKLLIIRNLKKAVDVLGISFSADGGVEKSKVIKAVSGLITQATINPKALEKKFEFLQELMPLIEKYKDLQ